MKHGLVLLFAAALAGASAASATDRVLDIGRTHGIDSTALREARVVNVVLPARYDAQPDRTYPVLYLIDGGVEQDLLHVAGVAQLGGVWGRSADAIVVGIETRDRRRELTGPTHDAGLLARYPTAGASAAFRTFIRDEVQPLIRARYRTNGYEAVLGESLAGLFIVEAYLTEPQLFDAYAAIDPSLWWDGERLSRTAARALDGKAAPPIYLAFAKEQSETPAPMQRVAGAIAKAAPRWCLAARPDLLHSTVYQQLAPQALQFLLPPATAPAPEFGFVVQCSSAQPAPPLTAKPERRG